MYKNHYETVGKSLDCSEELDRFRLATKELKNLSNSAENELCEAKACFQNPKLYNEIRFSLYNFATESQ